MCIRDRDNSLYKWTKDTIEDEVKKTKYQKIHSVYVVSYQRIQSEFFDI